MSRAEFQEYWLNHHGPLFKKLPTLTRPCVMYKAILLNRR
ncbi:MAG: EthD domain-containing protein [Smithella sp.]